MPNYRSLVGGFYSNDPHTRFDANGKKRPVSIRDNNPGAVNGAGWERSYPGYVMEIETTPGNHTTVFETPEHGIAAWWELMSRYRAAGAITVSQIIMRYGGEGQNAVYAEYVKHVMARTGLNSNTPIYLEGSDDILLRFAKAMFREEAGVELPWTDTQIMSGIRFGREYNRTKKIPVITVQKSPGQPAPSQAKGFWATLFSRLFTRRE